MNDQVFAPVRRATLLIPGTGPAHDPARAHLFVILTDPCPNGMVLVVPVCRAVRGYDNTCILGAGDHPFFKQKSYVAYYRLQTYSAAELIDKEEKQIIRFRGMLDEKVFALICNGVEQSRLSAPVHKHYFAAQTPKRPETSR